MQYINNFSQKRYKVSIATKSSNFFLFSLFWGTTRIYFMSSFFLIDINNLPNHIVSTVKQLAADDILFSIAHNAKLLAGELNSHIKANLNGHSSICCLIQIWIMLKKYIFMENDKTISLTKLFQQLLSAEIYLNEKLNLYYHIYWEISKRMQGRN